MEPPTVTLTEERRAAVERAPRRPDRTRRGRERLELVKAAALGDDAARSARWSGRTVATVRHWLAALARGVGARRGATRRAPAAPSRRTPSLGRPGRAPGRAPGTRRPAR